MRLDKFLWYARFFRSRALARAACEATGVRIAGATLAKAHYAVRVGDVLTFAAGPHIRVLRVKALPTRRGPPAEARALYDDLEATRNGPAS
jgi:ribosome-associated heat shock protein Hsp15